MQRVTLHEANTERLFGTRDENLRNMTTNGSLAEPESAAAFSRIAFIPELPAVCETADLIIEAVFEELALKHSLFRELEARARPNAILASNTSALPITEIAGAVTCADRVIGLHFMNPATTMRGVEIIRGQRTSDTTFDTAVAFVETLDKTPIFAVDHAGFIVSRLVNVLMNEAVKMVQEGNRPEDIDTAMKLCAGHPMGPCQLVDLIGTEIVVHGMETMARNLGEHYSPHPLLKKQVAAGRLGRKAGRGFYTYK